MCRHAVCISSELIEGRNGLKRNTLITNHSTSVVNCFLFLIVIVIYFGCFSNLILSLSSDCELRTVLNLM